MNTTITIAREYGSGGHEVGKKLAEKLGVPFYDKELIAIAAKESGMSEEVFAQADERASSSLLYSLIMGSYSYGAANPLGGSMPLNDKLFLLQADIIKKSAAAGPCVVVGRCADYVLRDVPHCLNVFIHADKLSRMERAVHEYGESPEKAADILVKHDKQRASYYNFYTSRKWGELQNYHIMLDAGLLGTNNAVALLAQAIEMYEQR